MSVAVDIASWILLVAGGLFCIVGAVGLLRMPDFYTRIHAASVSDAIPTSPEKAPLRSR